MPIVVMKLHKAGEPHCLLPSLQPCTGLQQVVVPVSETDLLRGTERTSHGGMRVWQPQAGLHLGGPRFLQGSWWAWGTPCLCKEGGFSIRHRSMYGRGLVAKNIITKGLTESLDCWRLPSMAEK